jgi:hypothetical protein
LGTSVSKLNETSSIECRSCKQLLNKDAFHKNSSKPSGRDSRCKSCIGKIKAFIYQQKKDIKLKDAEKNRIKEIGLNRFVSISEVLHPVLDPDYVVDVVRCYVESVLCHEGRSSLQPKTKV